MVDWPFEWDYPRLLLVSLGVVTLVALLVLASTSTAAFGSYNPAWDGASELRELARETGAEATVARDLAPYGAVEPNETVALVLAPDEPYTAAEAARLRRFVKAGGTLVIAEDFGTPGNRLLADLGASSRVNATLLRDERFFFRTPALPVADQVAFHRFTLGVEAVTLNRAGFVEPNGATVLVRTSEFAYADANRNGELDEEETLDSYPIIATESIGNGTLVVASDPSLFINVMLDQPGNERFVTNLFRTHESVVLDYSHAGGFPPLALAILVLRGTPWLQVLLGLGGLAVILAWASSPDWLPAVRAGATDEPIEPPSLTEDEVVAYLERQHPDWDEKRVRRVVRGVLTDEPVSRRDD